MNGDVTFRKGMTVWLKEPSAKMETAAVVKSANHKEGTILVEYTDRAYCDRRTKVKIVTPTELRKRVLPDW